MLNEIDSFLHKFCVKYWIKILNDYTTMIVISFLYQLLFSHEWTGKNITPWEIHQRANREKMMVSDRICQDNLIAYLRGKRYPELKEKFVSQDSHPYRSSAQSPCWEIIEITKYLGFTFTIQKWRTLNDITRDKK